MKDKVILRLVSFGYVKLGDDKVPQALSAMDDMMIDFIIDKVQKQIQADINDDMPEELEPCAVDMVVGEFFLSKKNLGQLTIDDIDMTDALKSVTEGDTSITFADGNSQAEMVDALISFLINPRVSFSDFRRIRW